MDCNVLTKEAAFTCCRHPDYSENVLSVSHFLAVDIPNVSRP